MSSVLKLSISLCLILLPYWVAGKVVLKRYQQLTVDAVYDSAVSVKVKKDLSFYRNAMSQQTEKVLGTAKRLLSARAPESLLSNLLVDMMRKESSPYCPEGVDVALINMGGIRSSLAKGIVKVRDVYRIMPFENELVLVALTGSELKALLNQFAKSGGEALSNVRFIIDKGEATSVTIGSEPLNETRVYWLATMDYLADGGSGMGILKKAQRRLNTGIKVRDLFIQGISRMTAEGKMIDGSLDGRIKIKK